MADLVICYSKDGEATAGRIASALSAEGFAIWTEEGSNRPIAERVDEVSAAIVVWTPSARASDWTRAEANYARGQKKLVQVTTDGDPPPLPFDRDGILSLAGWSGEPDHPGWQSLRSEVEKRVRPRPAAPTPRAVPARAPRRRSPPTRKKSGPTMFVLVLVAMVAAFAAFLWVRSGPPFGRPRAPIAIPKNATQPEVPALPPLFEPTPSIGDGNEMASPYALEPPQRLERDPTFAEPPPERPVRRRDGPRINRRNSENMRLFCERAGRGTPECRAFQRRLRNQ